MKMQEHSSKLGEGVEFRREKETPRKREERYLSETSECLIPAENMNIGMVIIHNGVIKFANSKFAEISGFKKEELVGMPSNLSRQNQENNV